MPPAPRHSAHRRRPALAVAVCLLVAACSTASGASPRGGAAATAALPTLSQAAASRPSPTVTGPPTATPLPEPTATAAASPGPSPIPTTGRLACLDEAGRDEESSLHYPGLPQPLEYRVHLPPCYDQHTERKYPVLYLIHGANFDHDQWDRLGADEAADRLASAGEIAPFILVLPRDRLWLRPSRDKFGEALVEALVPTIDAQYRTQAERSARAIGGLSRGASWSVHLGLSRWQIFGAIGAHSLAVFNTDSLLIREWLDGIPPESMPRIYLDIGERDHLMPSTLWFEDLLDERNIPHEWHLFPGYHEEAYWEAHVDQYIRWYAEAWSDR